MTTEDIITIASSTERYNLHSHTHFCDGRFSMEEMAKAACDAGFLHWGFSPHSPIPVESPCNMSTDDVAKYLDECRRLSDIYKAAMNIYAGMEVDYLGRDFGAHIDYFQRLPLDYKIGSVHFVPNQDGIPIDCDGRFERFAAHLRVGFAGDLRYVVEKYFEQVLTMLELGGFEILGHFDKVIGNASQADPQMENQDWYRALIEDVISHASSAGVLVEINTKAFLNSTRFYPALRWWPLLLKAGLPLIINSDAHYTDKINAGRPEAFRDLESVY